jgi:hypothetical protein
MEISPLKIETVPPPMFPTIKWDVQHILLFIHISATVFGSLYFLERNLNPKAACLKRREEEKIDDELPEKRLAPSDIDKSYDHVGFSPGGGGPMRGGGNRARRGRRSSKGIRSFNIID